MSERIEITDLIIVVPGILGSVIQRNGAEIWSTDKRGLKNLFRSRGRALEDLMLDGDDPERATLDDGCMAPRMLSDTTLIPGFWKIDGYTEIMDALQQHTTAQLGRNLLGFPYDWRRDNRSSARRLQALVERMLPAWRESTGNADAQVVLAAHSMGGLVSRYYLEVLGGWRDTRSLITFGTPFRGAIGPLANLTDGVHTPIRSITEICTKLVRSFTSVHQLVATWESFDHGDGKLVRPGETTGIPNLDPKKAAAGLAFHKEIWSAVETNRRDPLWQDGGGYELFPFVGTRQPTPQLARKSPDGKGIIEVEEMTVTSKSGRTRTVKPGGDGRVSRGSAVPRGAKGEAHELYTPIQHASIQNAEHVLFQVKDIVADTEDMEAGFFGVNGAVEVSMQVPDAVLAGQPFGIQLELSDEPYDDVLIVVQDAMTGEELARRQAKLPPQERTTVELPPVREGNLRVTVSGVKDGDILQNSDVLVAFEDTA